MRAGRVDAADRPVKPSHRPAPRTLFGVTLAASMLAAVLATVIGAPPASATISGTFVPATVSNTCTLATGFSDSGGLCVPANHYIYLRVSGESLSYSFSVPAGSSETLTYGIPAGGYVNSVDATVSLDGSAPFTINTGEGVLLQTTPTDLPLWTSPPIGAGPHTWTITSTGDSVNVYGLWIAPTVTPTSYSCNVPSLGLITVPVSISQTPVPPTALTVPGTFNSTLVLQATLPASLVNASLGLGVNQVTFDAAALTVTQDGGSAFTVTTQQTLANNLPVAISYVTNTPVSYSYVFNPLTWTAGPGSGVANFHPGEIDIQIDGNAGAFNESLQCFPPGPQAAAIGGPSSPVPTLATVTVSPPAANPALQVPVAVAPQLQQVTVGQGALWDVTVTNASDAPADNAVLSVAATTAGGALSFDLTGMAKSGSSCGSSGAPDNHITCALGTVAVGAHPVVHVIAQTTGLSAGAILAGTFSVTSTNAPTVSGALSGVTAEVIPNTVITAVVPGVTVVNTAAPLSATNPVSVKLKTPKKVLKSTLPGAAVSPYGLTVGLQAPAAHRLGRAALGFASASSAIPPPVSSVVGGIPTSQDNLLCPPTAPCYGSIAQVGGNFAAYNDKTHPIQALTTFFVGLVKPSTTLWMDKGNGTVVHLGLCTKSGKAYNTPCYKKSKTSGSVGKQSIRYEILFVGTDPRFGIRG